MLLRVMRKLDVILLGLLAVTLSGCRLKRPDDVLSPKKMEQFLYDFHMAQAISQDLSRDEKYTTAAYVEWAYMHNGITREQFETSLVWYTRYPKEFSKIYKHLSLRIDEEYKSVSRSLAKIEKKSFDIVSGDSVNLWYLDRSALLNSSAYMNRLTYKINPDTTFHLGDTLCLSMYGTFIWPDTTPASAYAYVSLSAYYPDSVTTADTIVDASGRIALSVSLDNKKKLSGISGSVNYLDSADNRSSLLLLSGLELMRYHAIVAADTVSAQDSTAAPAEL